MKKLRSFALSALTAGLTLGAVPFSNAAEDEVNYRPFSVGLDVGTLGLGGSASWRFSDHFGVRAGANYLSFDMSGFEYYSQGPATTVVSSEEYDTTARLLSESLALDIYPWANRSFRVTVGALFNQNRFTGDVTAKNDGSFYFLNGNQYLQSAVGNLHFESEQQPVCPFVTVGGSLYIGKARRWSVDGEIGVAYTGSADATLTSSISGAVNPADLEGESQKIEDQAEDYKFYPILKVSVNFAF